MRLIDADELKIELLNRIAFPDWVREAVLHIIDNAPTVEPCYQTTSCSDCKMYDKENHHCPRFCEVIRDLVKEVEKRPTGEWVEHYDTEDGFTWLTCSRCMFKAYEEDYNFCPNCGADMRKEAENEV